MDEREWQGSTDAAQMLALLRESGRLTKRKARLFACACSRCVWDLFADRRGRDAVEVAEGYADGDLPHESLVTAYRASESLREDLVRLGLVGRPTFLLEAQARAAAAASHAASSEGASPETGEGPYNPWLETACAADAAARAAALAGAAGATLRLARASQRELLCDVVSALPIRPVALDPTVEVWEGGLVVKLAASVYQERVLPSGHLDPQRLAVLADALEDAGADADLIAHLRSPGPHVRGCWAIDLLLGRE